MSVLIIKNIGTMVSGDIKNPILDANTVVVENGVIKEVGGVEIEKKYTAESVIDANGTTLIPGIIDTHVHPVLGDFSPRQSIVGFMESSVHGGITTFISAGEPHTPGRPKDRAGTKALAVLGKKSSMNFKPGGAKFHGGSLILEQGLIEEDFKELAAEGVDVVGEVGLGTVKKPEDAAPMVKWAKENGMTVMMHTGGTSIPGSSSISANDVIATDPDVVSHINGGPTSIPVEEVDKLIDETELSLEVIQCGNFRILKHVAERLAEKGQLNRILMGTDAPSGTGVIPLSQIRTMSYLASCCEGVSAAEAICIGTGNNADKFKLNRGKIEAGREADFVIMDAPMGSAGKDALEALEVGDLPGIAFVIVDGNVVVKKSKNTPPATRQPSIV
ncbi:enamidase [Dethiosulfatibacter aminovorans DSM 17477]|uniref:Enamidase n=1 Tax=Dethiosulfatibacter aminovorans DSM 17477 TaxID=1121476 RepID=A0A1M6A7A4_9FIRM|nr:amidohydrolase family protein [Dethiosulfatibacter aminovorans]SHI32289.1 enamidase [Dethiosulfatibacter aminovorans DSM 17477]